jgi:flagellar protein FlgJ
MAITGISLPASGMAGGYAASVSAKQTRDAGNFAAMLENARVAPEGRLNGDYTSGFANTFTSPLDKTALPSGAARNAPAGTVIDKTSALYEKALEFESYFVKIMLSAMRGTVQKSGLSEGENSFAAKMYEDMLYDELAVSMTKNAGFGLADQVYLELV